MTLRRASIALSILAFAWAGAHVVELAMNWSQAVPLIGIDYRIYTSAAERWLHGGGFYLPYQLVAPYQIGDHQGAASPVLYPPTMLLLFVPFTVLPWVLWWAIPITVTAWVVWHHRPRYLVWPVIAVLVAFPTTLSTIETGNPTLWFVAALALGTVYGWPAVLLFLKPTIAPLALIGIWHPSWWIALAGVAVASVLFLPIWAEYLAVLSNTGNGLGIFYSLNQFPALFIPVIAWLGSSATPDLPDVSRLVSALRRPRGTGGLRMAWSQP